MKGMEVRMKYNDYTKIKNNLNNINCNSFENIQLGNLLSQRIWKYLNSNKIVLLTKAIIIFLFVDKFEIKYLKQKSSKVLFVFASNFREDYLKIYNNTKETCDIKDEIIFYRKKKINLNNLKKITQVIKYFKILKSINSISLRIYLSFVLGELYYVFQHLKDILEDNYNLVVAFCDAHEIDNLITQYFKCKRIKTATLQHAQFVFLEKGMENVNCIQYENFVSDYLLAWGRHTCEEFEKAGISKERIKIVGSPKYIGINLNDLERKSNTKDKKIFGLILDQVIYRESNKELIKLANMIADELDYKYLLRLHPTDDIKYYEVELNKQYLYDSENKSSIDQLAKLIDFALLHTTSVYVDLITYLCPTFRYKDKEYFSFGNNEADEFVNFRDFMNSYNFYKSNPEEWNNTMKSIREYFIVSKNVESNYSEFFKGFY